VFNLPGRITDRPRRDVRDDAGRCFGGSVDQWVEELTGAVLTHGASSFILFSSDDSPLDTVLSRWGLEIVPAVREAIANDID
jgi:hypothetical protein